MKTGRFNIETLDCREADVLVVGSGAGGATAAVHLVEAGLSVVILEEGPYRDVETSPNSFTESLTTMWRGAGLTAALGTPPVQYAEGCCAGGSTEINSAIFQRAPSELLDAWACRYGIVDFGKEALEPHYRWAEDTVNATYTAGILGPPTEVLRAAGDELGWSVTDLKRGQKGCRGTNLCSLSCPTGGKQSITQCLLPGILASRQCRLVENCRARKLTYRSGRVTGVVAEALRGNGRRERVKFRARLGVFCCGGAIHSPALLQRSGDHGPRVGKTLRMHPTVKAVADFPYQINAMEHRLPLTAISEFMPEQRIGGSVVTAGTYGVMLAEGWEARRSLLDRPSYFGSYYGMVRAESTGDVRAIPGCREPLVRYQLNAVDRRRAVEVADRLVRAMFAAGANYVWPSVSDHPGWRDYASAQESILGKISPGDWNIMTIHMFSSLGMGEQKGWPVDSFGELRAAKGVVIADASVIPEAPGANPQATVMAISRRNTLAFLRSRGISNVKVSE